MPESLLTEDILTCVNSENRLTIGVELVHWKWCFVSRISRIFRVWIIVPAMAGDREGLSTDLWVLATGWSGILNLPYHEGVMGQV